ncbi:sensor domain-containing diguanylate cyclase [Sporosarcina aquimarina]|uniref:sensor domain-containing diguanylate cyclase n=1 Tax=Sporosarcina aquimarina TaxID=114975 RepID=UPI00203A887E|nr:sensor domain-containing diguanylate cyclase [Sporosarcina aquimarina]MCM3758428.1 sensor domain-containing diguanylate cyclase [Sporosarcina aquimarina]
MDERLDYAPCGYISLNDDSTILEINKTLISLLDYELQEVQGQHINLILTRASKTFYQLYFFPMIRLQEKVEAMYIALKAKSGQEIPILLNASRNEREGKFFNDCVCFPMKERYEYEQALLTAKRETDQRNRMKKKQIEELDLLRNELECKQNELLELNEKLRKLAETDGLTGLKNRRCLQESLTSTINLHAGGSQPVSLLLMDIDYFKDINDTFGHMTGDRVLQEMGRLLEEESRKEDVAARYGGEEFALILPNTDKFEALKIAERIRWHVEQADWGKSAITISVGAATFVPGDTESSLQSKADNALYASKNGGRNQVTHASDLKL